MTLQELLRAHVLELQDALQNCENSIRTLSSQRRAENERISSLQSELDAKGGGEEDKRREIRDIENKIEDLKRQLDKLQEEKQNIIRSLTQAEESVKTILDQKKKAKSKIEELDFQIHKRVEEKNRFHSRVMAARRTAFQSYLEKLCDQIESEIASKINRSEKIATQKKFEQARHEDPKIMEMYEARSELQKLLKVSNVPAVRSQLEVQLREIEDKIEKLFPGALSVESESKGIAVLGEVFFSNDKDGNARFYLPIMRSTWGAIVKGEDSFKTSAALRLVWALCKALEIQGDGAKFVETQNFLTLISNKNIGSTAEWPDVHMPMPGSGRVMLSINKLPFEVEEALNYENFLS